MAGFTQPLNTTDPLEILRYFQEESDRPLESKAGIGSKPTASSGSSDVMKFFADWWTESEEKVAKAREEIAPDMEELSRRSSEEAALFRMEQDMLQSLDSKSGPDNTVSALLKEPLPTVDNEKINAVIRQSLSNTYSDIASLPGSKDEKESAPVTAETTGAGLMTRPLTDDDTRLPSESVGEATTSTPTSNLLDFIGKGEGGYDSANRGTVGGNVVGSQKVASRGGKKVSEMTVDEIKKYQSITDPNNKDRLFTVGKYQAIPSTFKQAVKGLGLSGDTVFTPEVQEQVGLYLVSEKRPKVGQFIRGEGKISSDTAMIELAREFASVPVPTAISKGTYGKWPKTNLVAGDSFYKNPKASQGNRAQHTVEETRAVLEAAKQ